MLPPLANSFPFSFGKRNVSMKRICNTPSHPPKRNFRQAVSPLPTCYRLSLGLGLLLRGRDGTDLLHQAQRIPVLPLLDDLAVFDAMDSDPSDSHFIACGSDAHQFALVRTLCPPTANNLLPLSYVVLQRYAQVGEGGTYRGDELSQTLDATNIFVGFVHNDGVGVHLLEGLFEGIQAPLAHDLPGTASEGLVLFSRHILIPPFSPAFPGGLWLHPYIVEPSELEHMSQMHYFCLLDLLSKRASANVDSRKLRGQKERAESATTPLPLLCAFMAVGA